MSKTVTPAFDPSDNLWYLDDGTSCGLTARSLASLQNKLGPDVVIESYYPNGYGNVIRPRETPNVVKLSLDEVKRDRVRAKVGENNREHKPRGYRQETVRTVKSAPIFEKINWKIEENREKVRKLVEEGLTSKAIGELLNCSRNVIIGVCTRYGFRLRN